MKYDLARSSCFQLWPIIASYFFQILSPSEPIMRAKIENMISPDYCLYYIPQANQNFGETLKIWEILDFFLENFKL